MQKIKIGHRANFRAKYKCLPQILFPVRAILRSINFRCTDFITNHKNYNFLACDWFKKVLFSTNPLAKLLSDSLLLDSLLLDSAISQSYSKM